MTKAVLTILFSAYLLFAVCEGGERDEPGADAVQLFVDSHCIACHDDSSETAGLSLEGHDAGNVAESLNIWEGVLRRLERRQMPPHEMPRPDETEYEAAVSELVARLDRAADAHPNPGRTETFRRLTRTEYGNAIRDLLGLKIDVATLLPADEASHGFDNVTVALLGCDRT